MPRPLFALLLASIALIPCHTAASGQDRVLAEVVAAIDSVRGHEPRALDDDALQRLNLVLDEAWDTLKRHPQVARTEIRKALRTEKVDGFFIVDQALLLVDLDEGKLETLHEVVPFIEKIDPNANPTSYWRLASIMAQRRCTGCLPAVVRMLLLDRLGDSIPEHALTVDLQMGLLFSLGPFAEEAIPHLATTLAAGSCRARENAAMMLPVLLTDSIPDALRELPFADECPSARVTAWLALGAMGDPKLVELADRRLGASASPPSVEERLAIAGALARPYRLPPDALLRRMSSDEAPDVAKAAADALAGREEALATVRDLRANLGSADPATKKSIRRALERAGRKGVLEFDGSAKDLEAGLAPQDLPLVRGALASVLRRQSDECLYEFKKLYLAGDLLLQLGPRGD